MILCKELVFYEVIIVLPSLSPTVTVNAVNIVHISMNNSIEHLMEHPICIECQGTPLLDTLWVHCNVCNRTLDKLFLLPFACSFFRYLNKYARWPNNSTPITTNTLYRVIIISKYVYMNTNTVVQSCSLRKVKSDSTTIF